MSNEVNTHDDLVGIKSGVNKEQGEVEKLNQNEEKKKSSISLLKSSESSTNIIVIILGIAIILVLIYLLLFISPSPAQILISESDFIKPLSDQRSYRVVRLENNLDAVLISDPKASKSSASLSVGVGSFMDKKEVQGLAHFCEHMLFLGSKSYPKVGEFDDWLVSNSGMSNAFTEAERTTYFFEVDNKAFNKTLKMFSRMFAEPLFDMNYMNKEIDAVNSEHEKNLNADNWRKRQLMRSLSNPNHPHFKFATGSKETLRSVEPEKLNSYLHEFFNKYYSSHNMKLAIVSNFTLDEIQNKAVKYFSDISKKNTPKYRLLQEVSNKTENLNETNFMGLSGATPTPNQESDLNQNSITSHQKNQFNSENNLYGNLETKELPYRPEDLGKFIYFKRVSTGSYIDLIFNLPPVNKFYKIKPLDYIDYLLKYSGDKSLLNLLRKRKLGNKIDTGFAASHKTFSMYQISVELTNDGLKDVDLVIRMIFNYLNLIKSKPISNNNYEEIKRISEVNFKFQEKNDDYSNFLAGISTSMFEYDYSDILYGDYIHSIYDEKMIKYFMNQLVAKNSIIFIGSDIDMSTHKFFKDHQFKNETWYNTHYIESKIDDNYLNTLNSYPVNFDKNENIDPKRSFKLRTVNNFITNSNKLTKDCNELKEKCEVDEFNSISEDFTPSNLIDDKNLKIFYKIDKTFRVPKTNIFIKIIPKILRDGPLEVIYLNILANYLEYNLSTLLSESIETGNSVELEITHEGLFVSVNCFTDLTEKIMNIIVNEVFKFNPDSIIFDEIIEITYKRLKDNITAKPIVKNIRMFFNKLIKYNYSLYSEMLDILKKHKINPILSFQNFLNIYDNFKKDLTMTMFLYGNVDLDEVEKIVNLVKTYIYKPKASKREKGRGRELLTQSLSTGNKNLIKLNFTNVNDYPLDQIVHLHRKIDEPITFQIKNDAENEVNHAVSTFYQVGPRDLEKALYLSAMDKCLGQVFYYNLRTVQQLGYIVHAGTAHIDSVMYYRIIVQGSKKVPLEIEKSINDVFLLAKDKLTLCKEKFEEVKLSIKDRLKKKDDNLKERSNRIWREITENTYEFNRGSELLKNVDSLEHDKLIKFFDDTFFQNPKKLTIHNYSSVKYTEFRKETQRYGLNEKINITFTTDLNVLGNKEFISAYKNIKFTPVKNGIYRKGRLNSKKHHLHNLMKNKRLFNKNNK
jgi:secreted Zn-dependent insulinase-like peptidase